VVDTHDEHLDTLVTDHKATKGGRLTGASAEGAEMTTFLAPPFK
jgi:hypothetical protein